MHIVWRTVDITSWQDDGMPQREDLGSGLIHCRVSMLLLKNKPLVAPLEAS